MHLLLRRLETRIDAKFEKIEGELRLVRSDIVDLKVAVARIEGPQQTLLPARG